MLYPLGWAKRQNQVYGLRAKTKCLAQRQAMYENQQELFLKLAKSLSGPSWGHLGVPRGAVRGIPSRVPGAGYSGAHCYRFCGPLIIDLVAANGTARAGRRYMVPGEPLTAPRSFGLLTSPLRKLSRISPSCSTPYDGPENKIKCTVAGVE